MFIVSLTSLVNGSNLAKCMSLNILVNLNLMEENVIHIKSGVMINGNVSVKNIIYVKKIIFGILLLVVVKMVNV